MCAIGLLNCNSRSIFSDGASEKRRLIDLDEDLKV